MTRVDGKDWQRSQNTIDISIGSQRMIGHSIQSLMDLCQPSPRISDRFPSRRQLLYQSWATAAVTVIGDQTGYRINKFMNCVNMFCQFLSLCSTSTPPTVVYPHGKGKSTHASVCQITAANNNSNNRKGDRSSRDHSASGVLGTVLFYLNFSFFALHLYVFLSLFLSSSLSILLLNKGSVPLSLVACGGGGI